MKASLIISAALAAIVGAGCASVHSAREVTPLKQSAPHPLFASAMATVSPGVIIGAPAPYSGAGQGAISVKFTSTEQNLNQTADWWVQLHHKIPSIGVFDPGTYSVHYGTSTVPGYTPPAA